MIGSKPPDRRKDHLDVIKDIVRAWQDGKIDLETKRRAISDENFRYYGADCKRSLMWPPDRSSTPPAPSPWWTRDAET